MLRHLALLPLLALSMFRGGLVPTEITVRAVSRDAKVLGDGVGGARITITDLDTGKVLATGIQTGGTGDTRRIMQDPRTRGGVVYGTENAAAFRATLELWRPTRVEIIAEGPLKYPQAMQRSSRTMLLVPGQHIEGEGVLLEIPGFIVDVPASMSTDAGKPLTLRARVTLSCGCPTEPGGMWDANNIAVTARLVRDGAVVREVALAFAGETSTYAGEVDALDPGAYTAEVLAADPTTANSGRAIIAVTVRY